MTDIILTVIHISACLFLVLVVLLQTGKGADMGAVFGGSSSTVFGSSGAGNFLTRLTTAIAVVFMVTSLSLTYLSARSPTETIFDEGGLPPITGMEEEAAPGAPAPAAAPAPDAQAPPPAAPEAGSEAAPPPPAALPGDATSGEPAVPAPADPSAEMAPPPPAPMPEQQGAADPGEAPAAAPAG